ncbi:SDR family NAD(P)-dependent oxidoreductase [Parashewanella spongiae]|uniref:SDR family NAD(P)-dependent oxidoreductase n=1 Tax=Parashewanella spongiae TaxID=342950 RepID=A0A3A6TPK9_9GAMM|nr:SDR family NAD(P)-dependent oxidoreductase [Parashewanella spongiae]MCL1078374.1 SDR family NAD(P)-dependent oxidoreductase [Parashewanella spongiae]RJY07091.1 SDR family NAD(P)-dependent oxidoreductase [Parashewanella spongiae]
MPVGVTQESIVPTVVITGASKGVGAACARLFARTYTNGINLVVVAREIAGLRKIKDELAEYLNCNVLMVTGDIGIRACCNHIINQAVSEFDGIDFLINNAGLHHRGDFEGRSAIDVAAMVDVNLKAPIYLTAIALLYMSKTRPSAIVNVGSLAGRAPLQGAAVYSATKAGLRAFTYAMADELQHSNIKIAVVSPGPIDTGFIMDEIDSVEDIVYSQPMSSAEQVAEAVLALVVGKKTEISIPWLSGKLTTLSYLFPKFRRLTRPLLYWLGARNKRSYK